MANGDHLVGDFIHAQVGTTDATLTTLCLFNIPNVTGFATARGFATGMIETDGHKMYGAELFMIFNIAAGTVSDIGAVVVKDVDIGVSGYTAVLNVFGSTCQIVVTGDAAANVRWHGWLEVNITEQAFTP